MLALKYQQLLKLCFAFTFINLGLLVLVRHLSYKPAQITDFNNDVNNDEKYAPGVTKERLDRLFEILYQKELAHADTLAQLSLFSFQNVIDNADTVNNASFYFNVENGKVRATARFIQHLNENSDQFIYNSPRFNITPANVTKHKPVIVIAADSSYYRELEATVYYIHKHLAQLPLIIYDLGLRPKQVKTIQSNCKCELIKFNQTLLELYPHLSDLHNYAWKPVIIAQTLRDHRTVFYFDTSIRLRSGQVQPVINTLMHLGFMTQYYQFKLNCYTHPKMYEWFGETSKTLDQVYSADANIILFDNGHLASRVMVKAWLQCALDVECIAPHGAQLGPCCGCHRYDQSAITVASSFFFGHPNNGSDRLPAYAFTQAENFFFELKRLSVLSFAYFNLTS